jgi:hypothetical protein
VTGGRTPASRPGRDRHGAEGPAWRRIAAYVVARDGGRCHICGHGGAGVPDHLVPVTEQPGLALRAANLKAAHGYLKRRDGSCPVCSAASIARGGGKVYCNEIRGAMSVERARRVIEGRTGLALGGEPEGGARGERDWLLPVS